MPKKYFSYYQSQLYDPTIELVVHNAIAAEAPTTVEHRALAELQQADTRADSYNALGVF